MKKLWISLIVMLHGFGCACCATAASEEAAALRSELAELKEMMSKVSSRVEQIENRLQVLDGGKPAIMADKTKTSVQHNSEEFQTGPKQGTAYGQKGWLMNPDISVIANTNYFFRDGENLDFGEFDSEELNISEVELDIASYLYPGVRAWTTIAYEPEAGNVDVEEAFAAFETLPFNSSATLGRKFVDFGLINPIHQHFRPYVDSPLIVTQLFGEAYSDDGFLYSILLPTPGDLTVQTKVGLYDGRKELAEEKGLEFKGHVLQLGADVNHPLGDDADMTLAYDVLLDDFDGSDLAIHNASAVFRYYVPNSEQKVLWQNEIYAVRGNEIEEPVGLFSYLRYSINRYFDLGLRYDWTELVEDDSREAWAIVPSFTWNISESTYARAQYRHLDVDGAGEADEFWLQFVFGFGPHSHRVEF